VCVRACVCAGVCVCGCACRVFAMEDMHENENAKIRVYRPARVNAIYRWMDRFLSEREGSSAERALQCRVCLLQYADFVRSWSVAVSCRVCLVECVRHGDCWQRHLCRSLGAVEGEGGQQAVCSA